MLGLLLALLLGAISTPDPKTASVEELLVRLRDDRSPGRVEHYGITQEQLNQFLAGAAGKSNPYGLRGVRVQLENSDFFRVVASISIEEVKVRGKLISVTRSLLSGKQVLEIGARLTSQAGKARFEVKTARFNSLPIPPWLATSLVSYLARLQHPYVDPTEEFSLPYGITRVRITAERLEIVR